MTKENLFGSGACTLFSHRVTYSLHDGGSHGMYLAMAGVMHPKTSGASFIWNWLSCNLGDWMTIIVSAYQRWIIRELIAGENSDQWYTPMEQADILYFSDNTGKLGGPAGAYITVRSALPPEQMIHTLRSTVAEIDPLLALEQVQPMTEAIANVEAPRRFNTDLISAFALAALLLALTGIYAVVAFSASLRTHEIAIRMALGAQRTRIAGLILSSAAKLALLGCTFGVFGSLAVSRMIKSLLFEVSATDPMICLAGVLIIMTTAILASALPARRVASLDPIVSLRSA